jgi:hypothetical protein
MKILYHSSIAILLLSLVSLSQTTAFTYQGNLTDAGQPANGQYDMTFKLFDQVTGGSQIGGDIVKENVVVTAGTFAVTVDFGSSPFSNGTASYLDIAVRPGAGSGPFTPLAPRQQITSSPYAIRTIKAESSSVADDSTKLGGVAASQYVQTADPRLSDSRPPTPGSSNYIQNGTSFQSANFYVNTAKALVVDAFSHYNLNGFRMLYSPTADGVFIGARAG